MLEDLQSFARRRPGVFLAGAAVAGFGIGHAVRANSSSDDDGSANASVAGNGAGRAAGARTGTRAVPASPALARAARGR